MGNVYKITELVGTSSKGFDEAINDAIQRAAKSVRNMGWFEVIEQRGLIKDGQVAEFQATIKVGFKLED
jgi:flavin-binding protein dodecin